MQRQAAVNAYDASEKGRAMTRLVIGAVCWAILLTVLVYGLTFTAPAIRPMHPVEVHCTAAPGYVLAVPCALATEGR
jgi:TRAP-type C4-dicarboxylate transport system permease small subunit